MENENDNETITLEEYRAGMKKSQIPMVEAIRVKLGLNRRADMKKRIPVRDLERVIAELG